MLHIRKSVLSFARRFSSSPSSYAIESYKAHNEPILGYEKGSAERKELEAKLAEYNSQVFEVPVVIGDEEIKTDDVKYQVRPFDHQRTLAKCYYADAKTLQKAIDVSQKAHHAWDRTPLQERAEIFLRAADLISGKYRMDLMASTMLGQAKTIVQAEIDTACELADFYRFNVEFALDHARWQPISTEINDNKMYLRSMEGFWAAVAPFNFTAISGHIAGAPAFMGNVVLWKPSSTAVLSSYIAFKILREAGVPAGVVNFVPSTGGTFGGTVCSSPHLAGINFTGSAETFHNIWKAVAQNIDTNRSFPRLIGECGGKNFHFVHETADIDSVVNGTVRSAFEYSGQKCSACSRMYVPESKWGEIREKLVAVQKEIKLGDPTEADTFLSAVIDGPSYRNIKEYLDEAKSRSDHVFIAGGNCDDSKGFYIEPTIVQCLDPKARMMQEELFGPVLSVYVYKDSDYKEALKLVESTSPFSLTGAIYSSDPAVLDEAKEVLRFSTGNLYVNDKSTGSVVSQQPFGGARKSGTNDKAGGPHYVLRFCSPMSVKTTNTPLREWKYPYMTQ